MTPPGRAYAQSRRKIELRQWRVQKLDSNVVHAASDGSSGPFEPVEAVHPFADLSRTCVVCYSQPNANISHVLETDLLVVSSI